MNDKSFNLPKNIKQIGYIDPSLKIYIEDYAFTFIQQFSKENENQDKIAVLVGDSCNIDSNEVLFISAIIKPKYTEHKNSMEILTEKSFNNIYEQIETYFPKLKIVGWFYSRAGFEKEIHSSYIKYHKETFLSKNKVLLLFDPLEKIGTFFKFNENAENFEEIKGFIIYYERNEAMSEYMLNNQISKNPELEEKRNREAKLKENKNKFENKSPQKIKELSQRNINNQNLTKLNIKPNKKTINMFGSLTGVIIILTFIMGVSIIQSEDRISKLEEQLSKVDESYKYLLLQITNDSVQSVFAENNLDSTLNKEDLNNSEEVVLNEENSEILKEEESQDLQIVKQETSYDKLIDNRNSLTQEKYETYIIQNGDSLQKISKMFYGNIEKVSDIMALNGIENADMIFAGMSIKLP